MKESELELFWDGPFSQWTPSSFIIDDVEYNCAEQYMMAQKAIIFGDLDIYDQIMESDDAATQKKLGRIVENFDKDIWEEDEENGYPRCWNIVWRANMAKFSQNPHFLQDLLNTGNKLLVEASPYDTIWGVGMGAENPRILNPENWNGTNWLGEVLTNVRSFLRADPTIYNSVSDSRMAGL